MKILETRSESSNAKGIRQYTYTFVRSDTKYGSLLDSSIKDNEPIVISSENGQVALAVGYVKNISALSITVEVDKSLNEVSPSSSNLSGVKSTGALFRIDKDQLSGGSNISRNNLINLFIDPRSDKLRELIVDSKAPYFSSSNVDINDPRLNENQSNAVSKVLSGNKQFFK